FNIDNTLVENYSATFGANIVHIGGGNYFAGGGSTITFNGTNGNASGTYSNVVLTGTPTTGFLFTGEVQGTYSNNMGGSAWMVASDAELNMPIGSETLGTNARGVQTSVILNAAANF